MGYFDFSTPCSQLHRIALMLCLCTGAFAEPIHIPMRGIDAGTFYIEAQVGELGPVDFLVDTGSGYTTIDTVMLARLESASQAVFVKDLEGIMADGSRAVVPVYRVPQIRLGACLLQDVEVAIFGAGTRPILGMRALSRVAPFTFSTDPPGISLSRCAAPASADAGGQDQRPQAVAANSAKVGSPLASETEAAAFDTAH
jgi:hypothetical protein